MVSDAALQYFGHLPSFMLICTYKQSGDVSGSAGDSFSYVFESTFRGRLVGSTSRNQTDNDTTR